MLASKLSELLVGTTDYLQSLAFSFTRDKDEAKDLMQDTLYRALTNSEKYAEVMNLKAWLYVIMHNTFINNYRRRCRYKKFFNHASRTQASDHVSRDVNAVSSRCQVKEIITAVHSLPDIFKIPICLRVEGYNYQEIADMLDIALGTLKSRIHFGRKLLRNHIEKQHGDKVPAGIA
jgi:RNA polymerase sigma factor (sigma-70 family)